MTMMQGLWAVPYLMDAYGQTQQQAANALTLWAIGLIVGCTLWGYMADKIVGSRKRVVLAGAVVYALLWALLAIRPVGLPVGMLWVAMFWGGFFASTWIPSYAQLKDSVPSQVVATAMGILNLFFWLGGAVYQQVSGLILAEFPKLDGHTPVAAYQAVFWLCLGSVGLSIILVALSKEHRPAPSPRLRSRGRFGFQRRQAPLVLRLPAGRHVTDDRGGAGHLSALVLQERDRELDGDALTVLPHRGHRQQPLSVAGHPGAHDLAVAVPVSGAKALGDDQIQALSQGLVGGVPEHGLRPPVPQADHALPIGEDHRFRHLLHDPAKQPAR